MDLTRLRTLRELSVRGTMAAVAEALGISPSAVSQQIALLEAELGIALVERRGRGVHLTPAGARLVLHAETVIGVIEEARTDIAELKRTVAGELRVSAFPSVAAALLPRTIVAIGVSHPSLRIRFDELEPMDGLAALRGWRTDVALIDDLTTLEGIPEATIEAWSLCEDRLCVVLPGGHPLSGRAAVTLRDLRTEIWALDNPDKGYSEVVVEACRAVGFEPKIHAHCHGFEVVQAMVEAGCCISIQPHLRLRDTGRSLCVTELDPPIARQISVAFRRGEGRNPSIAAFLQALARATDSPSRDAMAI